MSINTCSKLIVLIKPESYIFSELDSIYGYDYLMFTDASCGEI